MTTSAWLIDMAILIDILRGYQPAQIWVNSIPFEVRFISVITAAELLARCRNRREQQVVERELTLYQIEWVNDEISRHALNTYQKHRLSAGVGFFDCLIAATAETKQLSHATLNLKHFAPFSKIKVARPY